MDLNKSAREEDNKVVMSKLPRDEFANFKKLCDKENKTINKKLRELINLEVGKKFGNGGNGNGVGVGVNGLNGNGNGVKVGDGFNGGSVKKFFIPSENKVVEMWEVEE